MASITEVECGVVYLLTSPSGKQYVGQSWCYEKRMVEYRYGKGKGQTVLQRAIAKHGWDNFTAEIVAENIQAQAVLDATEMAFIETLGTIAPSGYNLREGGDSGGKLHATTKAKLSAKMRGVPKSAEHRNNISASLRGRMLSPEHRNNIAKSMSGRNRGRSPWNKGKRKAGATTAPLL